MKFMTTWAFPAGSIPEAAERFLSGGAAPAEGVTILGRWHNVDMSGGYVLVECNDPVALYTDAARWADLIDLSSVMVIEDAQAGPVLANRFKK